MKHFDKKTRFDGQIRRNGSIEWTYSLSGLLILRHKSTKQLYVLKDNYMLVWLMIEKSSRPEMLQVKTGLERERLDGILAELKTRGLLER